MKVIIVGAGIAGLAAGVYARQCGFETTIYESHTIPGGNSTSWRRQGYLFEGGMHWLVGSSKNSPYHRLWKEIGALKENNPIYTKASFLTVMDKNGPICLYRDLDRLCEHLLSVSPDDKDAIITLIKDIKAVSGVSMPIVDIAGLRCKKKSPVPFFSLFKMLRSLPKINKLNALSVAEYTGRFKHSGIRTMLNSIVSNSVDYSAISILFTLAGYASGDCGYPAGGSLRMSQNIADTYTALGGTIRYGHKIERIEVQNGRACKVCTAEHTETADAVIVTTDTRVAIDNLFEKPLQDEWAEEMRNSIQPMNCVFVSIGVQADLSNLPENILFPLKKPFDYAGKKLYEIGFYNYARSEGYAPKGCTALTCFLGGDTYDEWKTAKADGTYAQKKENLAAAIIDILAQVIPETAGKVAVSDVATPLTYERYCGTWRGSWMSLLPPKCARVQFPAKSVSFENVYFAGQRLMLPGGLPAALSTARQAVQHLCKDNKRVFQCEYNG